MTTTWKKVSGFDVCDVHTPLVIYKPGIKEGQQGTSVQIQLEQPPVSPLRVE